MTRRYIVKIAQRVFSSRCPCKIRRRGRITEVIRRGPRRTDDCIAGRVRSIRISFETLAAVSNARIQTAPIDARYVRRIAARHGDTRARGIVLMRSPANSRSRRGSANSRRPRQRPEQRPLPQRLWFQVEWPTLPIVDRAKSAEPSQRRARSRASDFRPCNELKNDHCRWGEHCV